ncbi:MAG: para-nitrobenzyl esterase PnbA [Ramlibacter sp.]|nr:para-nitrobenzyl esterase PnbA [Ramlibacter sp.]
MTSWSWICKTAGAALDDGGTGTIPATRTHALTTTPGSGVFADTTQGRLQGTASSVRGFALNVFKGIPYAAPPLGPLRWRPPQPPQAWTGVRPALEFGPDFPQAPNPRQRGNGHGEDCLYLNVWAPAGATPGSLPVMVWIHGGGFVGGSGSDLRTDGAAMASQGVVVVSFNYRAGLFGFLAHPALSKESADGISGNYGLLDQIAALTWVKRNIAAFGGDPQRVTAFGVSAGSASISLLLASPMGKDLFQQAILHSPGAGRPLATMAEAEQAGTRLGNDIEALRRLSAEQLFALTPLLAPAVRGLTTPRVLRPIRDGWLLPQDERPVLKAGRQHAMPMIVGSNADEGSQLIRGWPVDTLAQARELVRANFGDAAQEVWRLYPASSDDQARPRVAEMFSDTQFNYGARLLARAMASSEPRTWRYLFLRRRPRQDNGPHHGDEVAHVFGTFAQEAPGDTPDFDATDEALSAAMMMAWVAFARHGNPNAPGLADWAAYDAAADNHLAFGDRIEPGRGWRREQLDFLDRFYG